MKDVVGYEGLYAVTSCGKVWSYRSQKFLKGGDNGHGYLSVSLVDAFGKRHTKKIHRLVAEAYLDNLEDKRDINHKDNCRTNNCINNLEWVTHQENCNSKNHKPREKGTHKKVLCVETGIVYVSQAEASRATGIGSYNISNCITGKQKTAGGYHWRYIDEQ